MNVMENIKVALRSIRANLLRASLTLLIIAVGITCLVGILTAIDTVLFSMSDSFNRMGANSFYIYPKRDNMGGRQDGKESKRGAPINFRQAMDFKESYDYGGAKVSINTFCQWNSTIKYNGEKTNPNVRLIGIDENYFDVSAFEMDVGRNFSRNEIETGAHKIIIASEIVKMLFDDKSEKALNQIISVGNTRYKVVGVLKSKGSSMSQSNDRRVFIPLLNAKRYYGYANRNYSIMTAVQNPNEIEDAVSNATGVMRNVRNLRATEENDFSIRKSDGILETLKEITTELRLATIAIALMTLLGAAIGLMNIMLVSVTERTREIGVRKALGATRFNILFQFIMEAIVITIMGGIVGIFLGIIIGLIVAGLIDGKFIIPFNWMALGIVVCIIVGVLSGLYPALKASRLDPIDALRYE
ncbi:MAG: FtsX-like permease family protein [Saprospiraceae bacterium]|nr:FtsX-like permease family protein [Saprospiraceae bacterium]